MSLAKWYVDLFALEENDRIHMIGQCVMKETPDYKGMVTVDDTPGKRERYIKKLTEWYPLIEVVEQGDGPLQKCVYFTVRKKAN